MEPVDVKRARTEEPKPHFLKEAYFIVSTLEGDSSEDDRYIDCRKLQDRVRELCKDRNLEYGDEIEVTDDIRAVLSHRGNTAFEKIPEHVRINDTTSVIFESEDGDQSTVVNIVEPSSTLNLRYRVSLIDGEDADSRIPHIFKLLTNRPVKSSITPVLVTTDSLEYQVRESLKGRTFSVGHTIPIGPLEVELLSVNPDDCFPTSYDDLPLYPSAYKYNGTSRLLFSSVNTSAIRITNGNENRASNVTLMITEVSGDNNSAITSYVLKSELEKRIRESVYDFVIGTKFTVSLGPYQYRIEVVNTRANTVVDENGHWALTRTCKFEITAAAGIQQQIVVSDIAMPLSKLEVEVANRGQSSCQLSVDANALKEAVVGLSGCLLMGYVYPLVVQGVHLNVTITKQQYSSVTLNSSPDVYLGMLTETTELILKPSKESPLYIRSVPTPLDDDPIRALEMLGLVGYDEEVQKTIRMLCAPYGTMKEKADAFGITPPRGLLLQGPPGTGKTSLARNIAKVLGVDPSRVKMIAADEVKSKWLGKTEQNIRELFDVTGEGLQVIIIDEIDALTGKRDEDDTHGRKFANSLLTQMDGLRENEYILVIGTTNNPDLMDPAFLRPGRFDKQIEFKLPSKQGRAAIFGIHLRELSDDGLLSADIDYTALAQMTDGMNGAHIDGIVRGAKDLALLRGAAVVEIQDLRASFEALSKKDELEKLPEFDELYPVTITPDKFEAFIAHLALVGVPQDHMHTMAMVTSAYQNRSDSSVQPPRGVLVHGPSGSGKSARVIALLKMMGIGKRRISRFHCRELMKINKNPDFRALFSAAKAAFRSDKRGAELQVIILDDIHLLNSNRSLNYLISCLAECQKLPNLLVVATSDQLDSTGLQLLNQPGRFEQVMQTKLPNVEQRLAYFTSEDPRIAEVTRGFTWAQLVLLKRTAELEQKRIEEAGVLMGERDWNFFLCCVVKVKKQVKIRGRCQNADIKRIAASGETVEEFLRSFGVFGLSKEVIELFKLLHLQYGHSLKRPKQLLLQGPSGTGKTKIAHALIHLLGVESTRLQVVTKVDLEEDLKNKHLKRFSSLFKGAKEASVKFPHRPWIVLIENIEDIPEEMLREIRHDLPNLLIIGTTTSEKPPKLFEKVIELEKPKFKQRVEIIEHLLPGLGKEGAGHTTDMTVGEIISTVERAKEKAILKLTTDVMMEDFIASLPEKNVALSMYT